MIDGNLQSVEYERLPTVCFGCGHYGHIQDICLHKMNAEVNDEPAERNASPTADLHRRVEEENFGSWMIVERKNRRKSNNGQDKKLGNHGVNEGGSRISVLDGEQDMEIHSTNEDGVNKRICNDLESKELTFMAKAPGPTKKFGDRSKGRGIMVAGPNVLSEAHKLSNQQRMALLVVPL
ncbi:hypothetical protein Golob_024108 [Gossypium lobatum]|uniref:CCHC-type domain-containing protein n=1 Tax=Gossypium lobatum TaxID=34289 RepID=A0A7J8NFH5_9ROSI|nr:hypothetical protein [Gossypium lobatum]